MPTPQSKCCPKCNVDRPLDRYYAYHGQCKNCLAVWQTEYFRKKPEKRRNGHNLNEVGYARLYAEQGGQCAICGTAKPGAHYERLLVDHCHATGKVRGLLCHGCNTGLGMFRDNPESLRLAIEYLKQEGAPKWLKGTVYRRG